MGRLKGFNEVKCVKHLKHGMCSVCYSYFLLLLKSTPVRNAPQRPLHKLFLLGMEGSPGHSEQPWVHTSYSGQGHFIELRINCLPWLSSGRWPCFLQLHGEHLDNGNCKVNLFKHFHLMESSSPICSDFLLFAFSCWPPAAHQELRVAM